MLYSHDGMPSVFVVGADWKLRGGVRAELRERGVEALGMERMDDAMRAVAGGEIPAAIVVDAECLDAGAAGLDALVRRVPILVVASGAVETPSFPSGVIVMRRPVSIGEVVNRVIELLQGQAA
jgi:DNA-binding response OmpR family regulator